jgi:hypothetical protein
MTQNTGVQAMAKGGPVKKMAEGDIVVRDGMQYVEQADGSLRLGDFQGGARIMQGLGLGGNNTAMEDFSVDFGVGDTGPSTPLGERISEGVRGGFEGVFGERAIEKAIGPREQSVELDAVEEPTATEESALGQDTGTPLSIPEGGIGALLPQTAQPSGGSGGGLGGGGGAGGVSSYEQALMDALASREKAATQDKWLALAQVGLNMMSSRSPTLLGAIGESGLKGVEAARAARDKYDEDKLSLQGALEKSRMARAAASARAASGAGGAAAAGGIGGLKLKDYLGQIKNVADVARNSLNLLTGGLDPQTAMSAAEAAGDLQTQSRIKTAYDRALQADQDYMMAVQRLGSAPTITLDEDDDTEFSVID